MNLPDLFLCSLCGNLGFIFFPLHCFYVLVFTMGMRQATEDYPTLSLSSFQVQIWDFTAQILGGVVGPVFVLDEEVSIDGGSMVTSRC